MKVKEEKVVAYSFYLIPSFNPKPATLDIVCISTIYTYTEYREFQFMSCMVSFLFVHILQITKTGTFILLDTKYLFGSALHVTWDKNVNNSRMALFITHERVLLEFLWKRCEKY